MNKEEAFKKWAKAENEATLKEFGERAHYGCDDCKFGFEGGWEWCEMNQVSCLADIRDALGDSMGRLTQDELVKRARGYKQFLELLTPGGSEFVNDPKACHDFVDKQKTERLRIIREKQKKIKEHKEAIKALNERIEELENEGSEFMHEYKLGGERIKKHRVSSR